MGLEFHAVLGAGAEGRQSSLVHPEQQLIKLLAAFASKSHLLEAFGELSVCSDTRVGARSLFAERADPSCSLSRCRASGGSTEPLLCAMLPPPTAAERTKRSSRDAAVWVI